MIFWKQVKRRYDGTAKLWEELPTEADLVASRYSVDGNQEVLMISLMHVTRSQPIFFLVIWKAGVSSVRLPVYICATRDPRWDWQLPFYLGKLEKCVIGQAWARNSWILADLFLAFLWTKTFWYFVSKTEHSGKSQPVLPVWKPRRMVLSCC